MKPHIRPLPNGRYQCLSVHPGTRHRIIGLVRGFGDTPRAAWLQWVQRNPQLNRRVSP